MIGKRIQRAERLPDSLRATGYFYWSARVNDRSRLASIASAVDGGASVWLINQLDRLEGRL